MEKNILLSYPRSGNHWVRFIIEWFSGRPTKGLSPNDPPIKTSILNQKILSHVKGEFIVHKKHGVPKGNINKLILILRNPKECIYRQTKNLNVDQINAYMKLINFYENYKGEKFLMYYEDLITDPKNTVTTLVNFMGIYDDDKINAFIENYDLFFEESIKIYDNTNKIKIVSGNKQRTSETKGKSVVHHSKKISEDKLKIFNEHINKNYLNLKKYIIRYE